MPESHENPLVASEWATTFLLQFLQKTILLSPPRRPQAPFLVFPTPDFLLVAIRAIQTARRAFANSVKTCRRPHRSWEEEDVRRQEI